MDIKVPLKMLKFGHEDGEGINARVAGRDDGIAALAANIFANRSDDNPSGLIENLIVKEAGADFYSVANGNRRLAALRMIEAEGSELPVPCTMHQVDETKAFEYSLTTAITAEQLHPVDQYEAFARLEEHGKSEEEIAQQYGMADKQVRQALALGRLSSKIRQAWREGTIKADVAKAFTLGLDHKTQDKAFDKLAKGGTIFEHYVKKELGADAIDDDVAQLLGFVGAQAYRDAGGHVTEDLFGISHIISDEALLKQMARRRLDVECERLKSEGWGWADVLSDLPHGARFWAQWGLKLKDLQYEGDEEERATKLRAEIEVLNQIEDEGTGLDDEQDAQMNRLQGDLNEIENAVRGRSFEAKKKRQTGCIVDIEEGRLVILHGVKRPAETKVSTTSATAGAAAAPATPARPATPAEADEEDISQALLHRLSVQLTNAAATALIQDEQLAISVLLAGVGCYNNCGVKVSVNGLGNRGGDRGLLGADDMKRALPLAIKLKPAERITLLTQMAANALDFQHSPHEHQNNLAAGAEAIINAIDAKAFNAAARGAFDAKDYFAGVSKLLCLKAIEEALGPDLARQQAKKTKPDIVAFAIENVPTTGWLPLQLRHKGYDGPPVKKATGKLAPARAKKPAKAAARKPTKKPAKKPVKKSTAKKRKAA
jgi:ParB family chromosome partitioning protein